MQAGTERKLEDGPGGIVSEQYAAAEGETPTQSYCIALGDSAKPAIAAIYFAEIEHKAVAGCIICSVNRNLGGTA